MEIIVQIPVYDFRPILHKKDFNKALSWVDISSNNCKNPEETHVKCIGLLPTPDKSLSKNALRFLMPVKENNESEPVDKNNSDAKNPFAPVLVSRNRKICLSLRGRFFYSLDDTYTKFILEFAFKAAFFPKGSPTDLNEH